MKPEPVCDSMPAPPATNVQGRLAVRLLFAFGLIFPWVTGWDELSSIRAKFWALAIFSFLLSFLVFWSWPWKEVMTSMRRRWPWVVLLLILCGYFAAMDVFVPKLILLACVSCAGARLWGIVRDRGSLEARVRWPLAGLVIWAGLSCIISTRQYTAVFSETGLLTLGCCLLLFLAVITWVSDGNVAERMVRILLAGSMAVCLIGILQYFRVNFPGPPSRENPDLIRSFGTMGHGNWFGTYLLLLFPFAITTILRGQWIFGGITTCLLYANILTSLTRGAWLGAAVVFTFLIWRQWRQWRKFLGILAAFAVITALLAPINEWALFKRAGTAEKQIKLAAQGSSAAGTGRFGFWKYGLSKLPKHAIIGAGFDTFGQLTNPGEKAPNSKAHSIYLEYAVTIGIPGLLFYLLCLRRIATNFCAGAEQRLYQIMIAGYLVQGFTIHDTIHTWPLLWLMGGFACVARRTSAAGPGSKKPEE